VADDVLKDFPNMETLDPLAFDSIILGLPSTMIDYRLLTKALKYDLYTILNFFYNFYIFISILYEGNPLLVLHPGRSEKAVGACKILAPGIFSDFLEFTTDADRFIPSKPSAGFYVEACKYSGISTNECVMIGDVIRL
jgi:ribonucleotide monophosphatase NagD (HAD superfamily)